MDGNPRMTRRDAHKVFWKSRAKILTKMNYPRVPIDRAVNRRPRVVRFHPMQLNHEEFVP